VAGVFISSTTNDLREYRDAAVAVVRKLGHHPIRMEDLGAVAEETLSAALKQIDDADLVIVIVARRYGQTREDTGVSMVETEFEHALDASKPILAFLLDDSAEWPTEQIKSEPRLLRFRDRLTRDRIVSFFSSVPDFTSKLETSLRGWAARRPSASDATLVDLPLAWRLVVASFAEHEFLRRPDPTAFVTAIEKWGEANKIDQDAPWPSRLEQARRALDNAQSGHKASALWLAWMEATRPMKAAPTGIPPDENIT